MDRESRCGSGVSNQAGSVDPPDTEGFLLAPSEISAAKIEAYRATDYRLGEGADAISLRIDEHSEALALLFARAGYTRGLFITAFNPHGQAQSEEANEAAHLRLDKELRRLYAIVIDGAGADPGGEWPPEKSFFALGVDLESSKIIGKRYKQDAIVWAGKDAIPKLILLR